MAKKEKWYVYPGPAVEENERGRPTIHVESGLRFDPEKPVLLTEETGEPMLQSGLLREAEPDEITEASHVAEQRRLHGDDWQKRAESAAKASSEARGKTEPLPPVKAPAAPPAADSDADDPAPAPKASAPAAEKPADKPAKPKAAKSVNGD